MIGRRVTREGDEAVVLARIPALTDRELRGWWWAVFRLRIRPAFDGESAALLARARSLGLNIKDA